MGKVTQLFVKARSGVPLRPVAQLQAEAPLGIVGDVSFGRSKRQVLVIEGETLDEFGLSPGQVRENVVVRELELAGTAPGTILSLGEVRLEVTMDCAPCDLLESIRPGLRGAIAGRRGTLCRVISSGRIQIGDPAQLASPPPTTDTEDGPVSGPPGRA